MATYTSSTFSTDNQYIKYRVQATTNSENVVNSTTNVTFKIQVWRTNTGYTTYGAGTAYLQVGGSTYTASITASQKFTYNSYTTVLTKTLDVARGELGNDSTYAKARVTHDRFSSSYQGYTFNFPAINRFALITASTNFTDEGTPSITYTNPAGTELVTGLKARITWNDGANYSAWTTLNDEGGTSNLTLTTAERNSMLAACSTSNSLAVQYDLQSTMDSTDYHHYADATMSVINADPTPGTLTYKDTNAATVAITGSNQRIVQLHSTLVINTTASTAKKQATITSYSLNINGNDYTPDSSRNVTFTNPNVAGTYPATMTTTDSRGNTSTAVINIPILQYSNPSIVSYSLAREGNFYDSTIINVTGSVASIDGHNTMTITEKHRVRGTGTWSTATTLQNGVDTTLTLSNTSEWEVMITVTDAFTSYSYTATVGKGIPLMFWDNKRSSVSVNGFPDADNQFYVGGDIKATGGLTLGSSLPITSGGTGANNAASARTNLGLGCTVLMSTPLTSGSTTVDASGYSTLLLIGKGGSATPSQTVIIPVSYLDATEKSFSFTHGYNNQYTYFYLSISNSIVTIRYGGSSNSGSLLAVYGMN